MKILFISQFLPYPPDTGGKIKTYQILKILSKRHQVFLISFADKEEDLRWEKELKEFCWGVKTFLAPLITTSHKRLFLKALWGFFNPRPFRLQKYFLKETVEFIKDLTRREKFEAVHFDHETSIQYLPYIYQAQQKLKIYDEHNISSEGLFGYARYEKNPLEKVAYLLEALKFSYYERRILSFFDKILTISRSDKKALIKRGASPSRVKFLPVPFKTENLFYFGSKTIFFLGLLSWWPNQDAILWFYKKVYPLVKKEIPEVKLVVAGAHPPKEILKINQEDSSVEVKGYVQGKKPFLKQAGVFVVPIRAGAGVRIKILDALAFGLPVVSTKMAGWGINLENGKNILLSDNEREMAQSVIKILKNKKLATQIASNGFSFIKENYSLKKAEEVLNWAYRKSKRN